MQDLQITPHEADEISNSEDYLDSRDIQERLDWLNSRGDEMDGSELQERTALLKLKKEYVDSFGEDSWSFGAQFIRNSYFGDYAQELAEDIGAVKEGAQWPNNCIDWEQAARELKMDYTEVDFDGVTYQTREA